MLAEHGCSQPQTEIIRLTGLSCTDCADKLERRISALEGVEEATINFTAAKLTVTHCDQRQHIVQAILDAGYEIDAAETHELTTSHFRISGLDCPDCAAGLAIRLQKIDGIESATINAVTAQLTVRHHLPVQEVIHCIEAAGYGAAPITKMGGSLVRDFTRTGNRFYMALISGALLVVAFLAQQRHAPEQVYILLYLAAMFIGGYQTIRRGVSGIMSRTIDMNVLMTVAMIGAVIIKQWGEGASIAFLYSISNLLESYTMEKTRQSIRGLMSLSPRDALVRRDGRETRVPVDDLQLGDIVIVKPGEKIPADGIVVDGSSSVSQAAITGEAMPVEKAAGDDVYAGTLNELGALEVRVTRLAEDSTLAKIIHLVEEAQAQRAPSQTFVDTFARYYTPAVLVLAALVAIVPPLFFAADWAAWFYRALALVLVACPCALVISTPVTIVTAIGNAARFGVLIKGGAFLEAAGRLHAIAFDKTGTLTRGQPEVTDIVALNGVSDLDLLAMAATAEQRSAHPLAAAILRRARADNLHMLPATDFTVIPGRGASACIGGRTVSVGNPQLFTDAGIDVQVARKALASLQADGKTTMLVGDEDRIIGIIAAADRLRKETHATIDALHHAGVRRVAMLTGDHAETARKIAGEIGLDEFMADLLPGDKVNAVQELRHREGAVGMVGDGINDAPALASANVGIAMGLSGTDTALETADITLMADDLTKLPFLIRLSRKSLTIIRQNITIALAIKLVAIVLILQGSLTLWMAVVADMGASLAVTLNGLRMLNERPERLVPSTACNDEGCSCCGDCHQH